MSQPTLLLISGNQQLLYLITRYGERSGCRVLGAETVEQAAALIGQERPAAVLLHLLSTPGQGWESLQQLKGLAPAAGLPIVIISAVADEARARAEGATYWLWQPVMYADFLAALADTAVLPQADGQQEPRELGERQVMP